MCEERAFFFQSSSDGTGHACLSHARTIKFKYQEPRSMLMPSRWRQDALDLHQRIIDINTDIIHQQETISDPESPTSKPGRLA